MMKRKRQTNNKTIKKLVYLVITAGFLIGTIVAIGVLVKLPSEKKSPPLSYEEVGTPSLGQAIGRIDRAVYECLSHEGVPRHSIYLAVVEPRHEKRHSFDFFQLGVRLKNSGSVFRITKNLDAALSRLPSDIQYKKERLINDETVYHIFVREFYTHKIFFRVEDREEVVPKKLPHISIIIDDLGCNLFVLNELDQVDLPLTLSVLPSAPYQQEIIDLARRKGWELMLHLPMEPRNFPDSNPGPGALMLDMDERQITEMTGQYLEALPEVKGVNNHMGSAFTENEEKMAAVLKAINKRHLFYIDSRTKAATVAIRVARRMGVPSASRSIFLDNDLSADAIRLQIEKLIEMAAHSKQAIGIGHPHRALIDILISDSSDIKKRVQVVPVSEMVD